MRKGVADSKKAKRLSKEGIKKVIIRFDDHKWRNTRTWEIHQHEKAAETTKRYEDIIKTKRKGL